MSYTILPTKIHTALQFSSPAMTCDVLPVVLNGVYNSDEQAPFHIHSTARITCRTGYKPDGPVETTCGLSEEGELVWVSPSKCIRKYNHFFSLSHLCC